MELALLKRPTEHIGLRIDQDLNQRIDHHADRIGTSRSALVRELIRHGVQQLDRQ